MPNPFPIPLNALRAIEIVARRGALAPAAEELGVTIGAVSQHLRRAEERLGLELFARTNDGLRPLPALLEIMPQLTSGFASLADGLAQLTGDDGTVLNLTVGSVFASRWLIWYMPSFARQHPEIELRLAVTAAMVDLSRRDIDVGIRFGTGTWPGIDAALIGGQNYQPVCSPQFWDQHKDRPLSEIPVIIDQTSMLDWPAWLEATGRDPHQSLSGPVFSDASLAFDAALSGQGLLLAVNLMSEDLAETGRLLRPFHKATRGRYGYYLATAKGRRETPKLRAFRTWLNQTIGERG
jgi:X-X-X-Leu-X-X-Gly heptad repeat protein